jgi:hypothetical protein
MISRTSDNRTGFFWVIAALMSVSLIRKYQSNIEKYLSIGIFRFRDLFYEAIRSFRQKDDSNYCIHRVCWLLPRLRVVTEPEPVDPLSMFARSWREWVVYLVHGYSPRNQPCKSSARCIRNHWCSCCSCWCRGSHFWRAIDDRCNLAMGFLDEVGLI